MATKKTTIKLNMRVETREREGYFASTTKPFAITVYGNKESETEERAIKAVMLLLRQHGKIPHGLSDYLTRRDVKHIMYTEEEPVRTHSVIRTCSKEMKVEVGAGI